MTIQTLKDVDATTGRNRIERLFGPEEVSQIAASVKTQPAIIAIPGNVLQIQDPFRSIKERVENFRFTLEALTISLGFNSNEQVQVGTFLQVLLRYFGFEVTALKEPLADIVSRNGAKLEDVRTATDVVSQILKFNLGQTYSLGKFAKMLAGWLSMPEVKTGNLVTAYDILRANNGLAIILGVSTKKVEGIINPTDITIEGCAFSRRADGTFAATKRVTSIPQGYQTIVIDANSRVSHAIVAALAEGTLDPTNVGIDLKAISSGLKLNDVADFLTTLELSRRIVRLNGSLPEDTKRVSEIEAVVDEAVQLGTQELKELVLSARVPRKDTFGIN